MPEPLLHYFDNELPHDHPLAFKDLHCPGCGGHLHSEENEFLCAWLETGLGAWCLPCVVEQCEEDSGFASILPDAFELETETRSEFLGREQELSERCNRLQRERDEARARITLLEQRLERALWEARGR